MSNNEAVAAALAAAKGEAVKTADARTTSKRVAPAADKSGKVTQSAADAPVTERPVESVVNDAAPDVKVQTEEIVAAAQEFAEALDVPKGEAPIGTPSAEQLTVNHEPMDPADATEALKKAGVIVDDVGEILTDTINLEPPLSDAALDALGKLRRNERDAMVAEAFEPGYDEPAYCEPAINRLPPPTTGHHPTFTV